MMQRMLCTTRGSIGDKAKTYETVMNALKSKTFVAATSHAAPCGPSDCLAVSAAIHLNNNRRS
jgi:hypothetical protein